MTDAVWQRPAGWARVGVPAAANGTVLDFLLQRFGHVPESLWRERFAQQTIRDGDGRILHGDEAVAGVRHVVYPRHPAQERPIPFLAQVLYQDEHILVADKPHFLPVVPGGNYVAETLLTRLQQQYHLPQLAPLHRLDKDTAGLVLFSVNPSSRDRYHALFRDHAIEKTYEAVASVAEHLKMGVPLHHRSRLVSGGARFFTMVEEPGEPNSETRVEVLQQDGHWALYALQPISGKKHQLRVHMAALGVPIRHDPFYPQIVDIPDGDFSRPLQLLARRLSFIDPVTGCERVFHSQRQLQWPLHE